MPVLAVLVALALSTQTQSLFGLDEGAGMTLLRMLPVSGPRILLAKDMAWLAALLLLIAPLSMGPALTFSLMALAAGHHSSVLLQLPQKRWRFASGRLLPAGAFQLVAGVGMAMAELRRGPVFLAIAALIYGASVWFYGRVLTRRSQTENIPQ